MIEYQGKQFARVSEILRQFSDFSQIDPAVLANKCRIGTNVHEAIADDIEQRFPCPDADAMGYFNSFSAWNDQLKPVFLQSEQRYYDHEKMITGQIDALIRLRGWNLPVLVDFKTSAQESKETWPMQAHLYNFLLKANGIAVNPTYLFVKLNKMGRLPEVFEYAWDQNIHAKCMNAIDHFWSENK